MGRTDVPQELWDAIIDILASDTAPHHAWFRALPRWQTDTLAACTLVCRNWLPRSSQHLFGKVVVFDGERFLQFITSSHRIALNVQTLVFTYRSTRREFTSGTVQSVVSFVPNLHSLYINVEESPVPLQFLPSGTRHHLKQLRLESMSLLMAHHYLLLFREVDHLVLQRVTSRGIGAQELRTLGAKSVGVVHLKMAFCDAEVLKDTEDLLVPGSIQRLNIRHFPGSSPSNFQESLRKVGRAITYLGLGMVGMRQSFGGIVVAFGASCIMLMDNSFCTDLASSIFAVLNKLEVLQFTCDSHVVCPLMTLNFPSC
jgi:hypothetical protein